VVNWNLCVIGEALNRLNQLDPATASRITDHRKIIRLRNQLIHGYGSVDHEITWHIVQQHLPLLVRELEHLLAE